MRKAIKLFCLVLALGLFLFSNSALAKIKKGKVLPDFALRSLGGKMIDNNLFESTNLGIMFFFKQDCQSCVDGLKKINSLLGMKKDDIIAIGVGKGKASQIANYVKSSSDVRLRFPISAVGSNTAREFSVTAIYPTTIITGPDARVLEVLQGKRASSSGILNAVAERLLQKGEIEDARELFKLAATGKDFEEKSNLGLGYTHLKQGKYAKAKDAFEKLSSSTDINISASADAGLAKMYAQQKQEQKAYMYSKKSLQKDPRNVTANTVQAEILYKEGDKRGAEKSLQKAVLGSESFAFEKSNAFITKGNLERKNKNKEIALVSYDKAYEVDPFSVEAISNKGVVLQEMGQPRKAIKEFKKLKKIAPNDKMVKAFMRKAKEAIEQRMDIEKSNHIRSMVKDLSERYKNNLLKDEKTKDDWTVASPAVFILDFDDRRDDLGGRIGDVDALKEEMVYELEDRGVKVVERELIDKLLEELNLGSSVLADKDAQTKLGKLVSAKMMVTGRIRDKRISMRGIDVETTRRIASKRVKGDYDIIDVAIKFAEEIEKEIKKAFPIRAKILKFDGQKAVVNLGKKDGIFKGMTFKLLEKGMEVEERGKKKYLWDEAGTAKISNVTDEFAYADILSPKEFSKKKEYRLEIEY